MIDIHVFIASCGSSIARSLVDDLHQKLTEVSDKEITFDLIVERWYDVGMPAGKATLNGLIDHARRLDFAIIVLTGDDLVKRGGSLFDWALRPRDNVVFEAGLFMGGLGLDSDRTLLLSSVRSGALLSDLDGITFIPLSENDAEREKKLKAAVEKIRERVVAAGPYIRHGMKRLKKQDVFDREKPVPTAPTYPADEYLDANSSVVVCSNDPLEAANATFTNSVFENISSMIRYEYFFPAESGSMHRLVSLVFRLLTRHATATIPYYIKAELDADTTKLDQAEANLVSLAPYLTVHLMPERPAFRFCVHNAEIEDRARCYFRHEKDGFDFVTLKMRQDAKRVADRLLAARTNTTTHGIFAFINSFTDPTKQNNHKSAIEAEVDKQFPMALASKVKAACFR